MDLIDFFPRPKNTSVLLKQKRLPFKEAVVVQDELKKWLVRRVECIRGFVDIGMPFLMGEAVLKLTYTQMLKSSQPSTMPAPSTQ